MTGMARSTTTAIRPTSGVIKPTPMTMLIAAMGIAVWRGMSPVDKAAVAVQAPTDKADGYAPRARVTRHIVTAPIRPATRNARK